MLQVHAKARAKGIGKRYSYTMCKADSDHKREEFVCEK